MKSKKNKFLTPDISVKTVLNSIMIEAVLDFYCLLFFKHYLTVNGLMIFFLFIEKIYIMTVQKHTHIPILKKFIPNACCTCNLTRCQTHNKNNKQQNLIRSVHMDQY